MNLKPSRPYDPRLIAGVLAVLVALWLLSGVGSQDEPEVVAAEQAQANTPLRVMVRESTAQNLMREAMLSAVTEPLHAVELRAEISARVSEVLAERGEAVKAGDVLLRLDSRDRPGQLIKTQDLLRQHELQYQASVRLRRDGHISELEMARVKANLSGARADLQRLQSELERTEIRAPFDGILETRPLETGDFANVGDLLATVIQQSQYLIVGDASEDDVSFLRPGQVGSARLSDGRQVQGTVHYIAAQADPAARTFRVELLVDNTLDRLIVGTSAALMLPLEEVNAHVLDPASLALNKLGEFGLKAVDEQGVVAFHPARIAQNRDQDVWLVGLPKALRVITVGQGFVSEGDQVTAVPEQP